MNEKLLKAQALYNLLDYESYVILLCLVGTSWLFYKFFLQGVTPERHQNLKNHYKNTLRHALSFSIFFIIFKFIFQTELHESPLYHTLPYVGLLTFIFGTIVFVKTSRLLILQYLFLSSIKAGVPILIVNIFSLLLSLSILLWAATYLFGIQLGPLLATSAAFSIILGLALQDTLGNLFAGISLQLDRSFEIGDWLEVINGSQKIIGQVKEITWRAAILTGWSYEFITIPNRTMANSQISNFRGGGELSENRKSQPIIRSQIFRLPLNTNTELAKQCLLESIKNVSRIRSDMDPIAFIFESNDSWLGMKLVYYIDSYGSQFIIGDEVLTSGLKFLKTKGIEPAHQTIQVLKS